MAEHKEDKLEYIRERVEDVVDKVHEIDIKLESQSAVFESGMKDVGNVWTELRRNNDILTENTISLKAHIHRTDVLEDFVRSMEERFSPIEVEIKRKEAVADYVSAKIRLFSKIGGAITAIGGAGMFIRHLLHLLAK